MFHVKRLGWWVGCDLWGELRVDWTKEWKKIEELDFSFDEKGAWKRIDLKRCFISRALFLCFAFLWFIFVFVSRETLRLCFWNFSFWICFTWNSTVVLKAVLLVCFFMTSLNSLFLKLFHVKQTAWCKCCLVRSNSFVFHVKHCV